MTPAPPAVVEVIRSGIVESRHVASVAVRLADGSRLAAGDVDAPMFPRSSNKPLQAVGMLRSGLSLPPDLLAVAVASHSGEPIHIAAVRDLLARFGVAEEELQTPPDWPVDADAARDVVRAGGTAAPLLMNCSGKHAAMLATCVVAGWERADYLSPAHPLQAALRAAVADLGGERVLLDGIDGCGAPVFGLSLRGLARAFARLATAPPGSAEHQVATAVRRHPVLVGGSRRDVTRFLTEVPGLVAKDGAEGVYAAALPDGGAAALKVADGAERPRAALLAAALGLLGVDGALVAELGRTPVLGGGQPVGEVRVTGMPRGPV